MVMFTGITDWAEWP